MLFLRGVLQESASHAMRGARGLSVPTGGRELADPWCHVCGRVCEFALKSFVSFLGDFKSDFSPKTRTNKLRQGKRCGIRRAHHMQVHLPSFFQKQKISGPGPYSERVSFFGTPSVEQPSH